MLSTNSRDGLMFVTYRRLVSVYVCAIQHIFKSIHWNLCECRLLFVFDIFFKKKYLAQLYFMSLIHMKYFLIKYACLTTIITTLVSLNCVKSVTVELNVKAKYYHMLCVSKAV